MMMSVRYASPSLAVAMLAVQFPITSLAQELQPVPAFSPDIHFDGTRAVVADEEVSYQSGKGLFDLGALPATTDVDAMHGLASGAVLFSLKTSVVLGETLYRPSDVIRFNGSVWSKELDGKSEGIPDGVNVDAIAMSGDDLLLSLDVSAELDGIVASDADVLLFDGANFSIFLSTETTGIGAALDINALHLDEEGRVLVSFDGSGDLGGVHFRDEDLLAWESSNWSQEFDGSDNDAAWLPADLDAWSIVFINDTIFKDGFESE